MSSKNQPVENRVAWQPGSLAAKVQQLLLSVAAAVVL
jgi:hypothetical protein